jgi:hypothetical protein
LRARTGATSCQVLAMILLPPRSSSTSVRIR